MKKQIVWEKWRDPLLSNLDDAEWPGYDLDADGNKIPLHTLERQPVLNTPHGMLSVTTHAMANSQFDFWIMHTNFDITEGIASMIDTMPGVESLEIYTRYRARIGFPRSGLFDNQQTKHNILKAVRALDHAQQNQALYGLELQVAEKVMDMRDNVENKFEHWIIWVVPNGNIEVVGADKIDEDYKRKVAELYEAQAAVGGRILTSETEEDAQS